MTLQGDHPQGARESGCWGQGRGVFPGNRHFLSQDEKGSRDGRGRCQYDTNVLGTTDPST